MTDIGNMDPELLELFPDTVVLERYNGTDDNGNDQWDPALDPYPANLTVTAQRGAIGDHDGVHDSEVVFTGSIIVPGGLSVGPRDKITFLSVTQTVTTVETFRDAPEQGDYVQVITFEEKT